MGSFFVMKNILKTVCVIIGTIIGAGFASGQEVYIFFFSHGIKGLIGIIISSVIIGLIIYKSLKIIKYENIQNYDEFLKNLIRNKKIKDFADILINIFIFLYKKNYNNLLILLSGFRLPWPGPGTINFIKSEAKRS